MERSISIRPYYRMVGQKTTQRTSQDITTVGKKLVHIICQSPEVEVLGRGLSSSLAIRVKLTKISDTADAARFHEDVFAFEITVSNARLACNEARLHQLKTCRCVYYNSTSNYGRRR